VAALTRPPVVVETPRLVLRPPTAADADLIFTRYASDPDVTRYVGWPRHRSVDDTLAFVELSRLEWQRWPAGPYLAWSRDGRLLGSTGLAFETPMRAATGYVFAVDAWRQGYATEALSAMTALAERLGVRRLYALCHAAHRASWRVLEKGGFLREGVLRRYAEFPNLSPDEPADVYCYSRIF
jgi:[ribosomal protein S5]-alanine N-acetyltransferase